MLAQTKIVFLYVGFTPRSKPPFKTSEAIIVKQPLINIVFGLIDVIEEIKKYRLK